MISQSGTFYKIIVTSCVLLGVNRLSPSNASPVVSNAAVAPTSISHASFNLQYPPSAPTGTGLFFTAGDIAAAESGSFFGDGALASHPLHGIVPGGGMNLLNIGSGGNQFLRAIVAPQDTQGDDLLTAGQSYFIEPPTPTTTTQKPTFKKRKTRRPISSLAEKSKKAKAAEIENSSNNEVFQGNPVSFNPFRQIVNTSFGRKRPSDNRQERPRSRANAVNQETGSAVGANKVPKSIDSLNEIQKTEGEPRALGRRRPAQDVRPLRPTTTVAGEDTNNTDEPPKARRFPLRKPRPSFDGPTAPVDDAPENANLNPLRPRKLIKRPRPRPTTTVLAPTTETDIPTETTEPFTVSRPLSTQPTPVLDGRPKVRPARPLGVSRFANANRNTVTTTPSASDSGDESSVPSSPPSSSPRRRPLRPTTRQQSLTTSTEAPEDILGNLVSDASPAPGRGRGVGAPKQIREGRQGFLLRPRPTPNVDATENADAEGPQNEVGIRRPLSNRRRKRPTTTIASPASPVISYNQEFTGGVVERNVENPSAPARERVIPGRRAPQALRSRPTPPPSSPANGSPPAYQIREEQPVPRPIDQSENLGNPTGRFLSQHHGNPAQVSGPSLLRRPISPAQPSAVAPPTPIQQTFNRNAGFVDPNNFVNSNPNFFRIPSHESFFAGGLDNVLGIPSNFRTIQQIPSASDFSARSTSASNEPEISHNDFSPAASTEKQSVSPSNSNAEIADSPITTDGAQENKPETEENKIKASPAKLSPLERLQQNRQAAARRLLSPRKPTEKTTLAPATTNQKIGKNFRKSIIPPRMLRPRGKLPGATSPVPQEEQLVPDDGRENDSGAVEEKPSSDNNAGSGVVAEIINESTSSAAETDKESNTIPISPNPKEEEKAPTSTRKPSILEAAKRRRVSSILSKNIVVPQQQIQKIKITPPPQPSHDPETSSPPTCEDGQRYSKFLKRCVTMYKPKAQG